MSVFYDSLTHNLDQPKLSAPCTHNESLLAAPVWQKAGRRIFWGWGSSAFSSLLEPVNDTPCVRCSWHSAATESLWASLPRTNEVLSVWLKKGVQAKTSILDRVKIESHCPLHPPSSWLLRGYMTETTKEHGVHLRNTPTLSYILYPLFPWIPLQIMDKSGEQKRMTSHTADLVAVSCKSLWKNAELSWEDPITPRPQSQYFL